MFSCYQAKLSTVFNKATLLSLTAFLPVCGGSDSSDPLYGGESIDITDVLFMETGAEDTCNLIANNIPNNNSDDETANCTTQIADISQTFSIPINPVVQTPIPVV